MSSSRQKWRASTARSSPPAPETLPGGSCDEERATAMTRDIRAGFTTSFRALRHIGSARTSRRRLLKWQSRGADSYLEAKVIDPYFEERLVNWGRRSMQKSRSAYVSSFVSVEEELRRRYGPPEGDQTAPAPLKTIDEADADILDKAYRHPGLAPAIKQLLKCRYCDSRGDDDRWVERRCGICRGGLDIRLEAAVLIFRRIVESIDKSGFA